MANVNQIKIIHALKGALSLDESTYREMLAQYGAASSAAPEFTDLLAADLIARMEASAINLGVWKKLSPGRRPGRTHIPGKASDAQKNMIRALWAQVSRVPQPEQGRALNRFIEKRFQIAFLDWLPKADVGKVVYVLRIMIRQKEKRNLDDGAQKQSVAN